MKMLFYLLGALTRGADSSKSEKVSSIEIQVIRSTLNSCSSSSTNFRQDINPSILPPPNLSTTSSSSSNIHHNSNSSNHPPNSTSSSSSSSIQIHASSSLLSSTSKNNILLFGMSFPQLSSNLHNHDDIFKLICTKKLPEIEGRDFVRILSLIRNFNMNCYTISLNAANPHYHTNHSTLDYNNKKFTTDLKSKYPTVQFSEVVMDYFWLPSSWQKDHWKPSLFFNTLPSLWRLKMILPGGFIYFPLTIHAVELIVAGEEYLNPCYSISFVSKEELSQISLWKATQFIDPTFMENNLMKAINQEEQYCQLSMNIARQSLDGSFANPQDEINFIKSISELGKMRFIRFCANRY